MASGPKILAFAGSAWKDPFNKKLVKFAVQGARGVGAQVTELDFADLPLPLFDQDVEAEEGLPAGVIRLKELMREHDGFLIASPEYNSSISPMLKNARLGLSVQRTRRHADERVQRQGGRADERIPGRPRRNARPGNRPLHPHQHRRSGVAGPGGRP